MWLGPSGFWEKFYAFFFSWFFLGRAFFGYQVHNKNRLAVESATEDMTNERPRSSQTRNRKSNGLLCCCSSNLLALAGLFAAPHRLLLSWQNPPPPTAGHFEAWMAATRSFIIIKNLSYIIIRNTTERRHKNGTPINKPRTKQYSHAPTLCSLPPGSLYHCLHTIAIQSCHILGGSSRWRACTLPYWTSWAP